MTGSDDTAARPDAHLRDIADGCGCAEVWEHTSAAREEDTGSDDEEGDHGADADEEGDRASTGTSTDDVDGVRGGDGDADGPGDGADVD